MTENQNIQIADIEQTFSSLKNHQEKNQIHASLFNLVVYSAGPRRTTFLRDIVSMVIERFPCRIFFIEEDPQSTTPTLIVTATQERIKKGDTYILCDEIKITSTKDLLKRVPFIVLPHFVPDLPIFLLWGQDPNQDTEIFPHLEKYASRLVFDAECSSNLQQFCKTMMAHRFRMEVMDLNWALTSGWRRVFAQTFDTEQKFDFLRNAKTIQILYNRKDSNWLHQHETQAAYLQGWLAAKCGWRFIRKETVGENIRLIYSHSQGELALELSSASCEELNPGAIIAVELDLNIDQHYHMFRPKNASKVRVEISSLETCELPCIISLPNLRGFLQEIFYQKTSEDYLNMIQAIAPINWGSN